MADLFDRFIMQPKLTRFVALAVMGVVAGLGQAPTDLWFLTVLALAGLFALYPAFQCARQSAFHLWAFGFGYFAFSLRWIVEPFLVDIATHGWMAPFALVFMGAGAALFWALAGWVAMLLAPRNVFALSCFVVLAEVLRALVLTGFPWALLGHVWIGTGLAQLASFAGPHFLTFVTVCGGVAIAGLIGSRRILSLVFLGMLSATSFVMQPDEGDSSGEDLPLVRLVQPNAPQSQKWDPAFRDVFLNRMISLTGEGVIPDLVVWPETAIPFLLNHIDDDLSLLSDAARGAPLVFGIQRRDAEFRAYNSLVVMGPGGTVQSIYDKRHLVPFGEYMPGARLLGQMGATGLAANLGIGFTPGQEPGPLMLAGIGAAVPLICYEGIFAEEIDYGDTRARLLMLITNDAWFGDAAGPRQHLAQARLRAIEQGLPMVRVANTGISAMIDSYGRITALLPMGVDGALDARLPPALSPTPYSRYGEWPFLVFLVLVILGVIVWQRPNTD